MKWVLLKENVVHDVQDEKTPGYRAFSDAFARMVRRRLKIAPPVMLWDVSPEDVIHCIGEDYPWSDLSGEFSGG